MSIVRAWSLELLNAPLQARTAIQKVRSRRKNRAWRRARPIPSNLSAIGGRGRRGSRKPLYVSAVGCRLQDAADRVLRMHGPHRIPTLVRRADQLFPLRLLIASTAPAQFTVTVAEPLGPLWPLLAVTVTGAPVLIARTRPVLTESPGDADGARERRLLRDAQRHGAQRGPRRTSGGKPSSTSRDSA